MEAYFGKLRSRMDVGLETLEREIVGMGRYEQGVKLLKKLLDEGRRYLAVHPFEDKGEEIVYFKTIAPVFYANYFFYIRVYMLTMRRMRMGKEEQRIDMEEELKKVGEFFAQHGDFLRYILMGGTYLDDRLFVRGTPEDWIVDEVAAILDDNFCLACYRLSWIRANEEYRQYLTLELERMLHPQAPALSGLAGKRIEFVGTNADAGEWIASFSAKRVIKIDGVPADTKMLAWLFENIFQKKLGNVYDIKSNNLKRKKDKTPWLNGLIGALVGS